MTLFFDFKKCRSHSRNITWKIIIFHKVEKWRFFDPFFSCFFGFFHFFQKVTEMSQNPFRLPQLWSFLDPFWTLFWPLFWPLFGPSPLFSSFTFDSSDFRGVKKCHFWCHFWHPFLTLFYHFGLFSRGLLESRGIKKGSKRVDFGHLGHFLGSFLDPFLTPFWSFPVIFRRLFGDLWF